jgi:2,3-bisphosphoglycerate-independent phosphoglycerate mutase
MPTTVLLILDGWGHRIGGDDNAIAQARTPVFEHLWQAGPRALLQASGEHVGLPAGQMGNSEVGHLTIGAGRVLMQDLPRVDAAIADGSLARNPRLTDFVAAVRAGSGVVHLCGLVSDGGVHSHIRHATALVAALEHAGLQVRVHAWLDGRDTPPGSAADFLMTLMADAKPGTSLASVAGRYYAMDRDQRWDRTLAAYRAMVGAGPFVSGDPLGYIKSEQAAGRSDEFICPGAFSRRGIADGDGVLFFNFRSDRMRQIASAFAVPRSADQPQPPRLSALAGMTSYSDTLDRAVRPLFPPQSIAGGLGEVVSAAGLRQVRVAETEKYPHVTYFMNGGREEVFPGEERVLVPSPKVATYDLRPEMSVAEVAGVAVRCIADGSYDLVLVNFANPDMVGHTGNLAATVRAVEATDQALDRIAAAVRAAGGQLLVLADHGNAEQMRDPVTGQAHTAHTCNPVPVVLAGAGEMRLQDGGLADVAPTVLELMKLRKSPQMTGSSLLVRASG